MHNNVENLIFLGLALKKAELNKKKEGFLLINPKLNELILKDNLRSFFQIIINKIKNNEEINLLFYGGAGTGKTYTSKMLACELNKRYIYLNGCIQLEKIQNILKNSEDAVICIDEIHNLPRRTAEMLYSAIESRELYIESTKHNLKGVVFVGTTTEIEKIPKPLRDRFISIYFEDPKEEQIKAILRKENLSEDAINKITGYTTNIRKINKILKLMKMVNSGGTEASGLDFVFSLEEIDKEKLLSKKQIEYIEALRLHGVLSARSLAFMLGVSETLIKEEIEPDLIRKKLITITSRGRKLQENNQNIEKHYIENKKERIEDIGEYENKELEKFSKSIARIPLTSSESRIKAREYINRNPHLKKQYEGRLLQLINFLAKRIDEGIEPDLIDLAAFSDDCTIEESYKNNYLFDM